MSTSSSLRSWLDGRSQHVIGGLLGAAGALHFALWTQDSAFLADLQAGQLATAAAAVQTYLAAHPAYPVFFVLGIIVLLRASRS
ncbi:hypothetical protein [Halocalculus aciditolerans]|uniref:Uncharacterized protein n=1 Tax=Halocalculus aciditolerans TaxID=1383812 RepID=A0A830F384_9EURY|nr:hypothetical protein [Halocalculus aciditolerans]GGL58292.1 hypothetical protein GCM10009039_15690 [Halocalculus aciditolerans]